MLLAPDVPRVSPGTLAFTILSKWKVSPKVIDSLALRKGAFYSVLSRRSAFAQAIFSCGSFYYSRAQRQKL
jgi:hypothetical protein